MPRPAVVLVLFAACGGSGATQHDGPLGSDARPSDGRVDAPADAPADVPIDGPALPMYSTTPTQTLVPPAGVGNAYGVIAAISADGKTLVTFDVGALYVFTRTTGSFPTTPSQTLKPSGVSVIGTGLSLSADGALLACGGMDKDANTELLVFTRQGSTYADTPQILMVTTSYSEVAIAALAPDGSELAHDDGTAISIVPRVGSMFSGTPSLTVPPPTGASEFFGGAGALSGSGTTLVIGDSEGESTGAAFVYSSGATTPAQTLTATTDEKDFATAVALRADGEELVEGAITPGQLGVFQRGQAGYVRVQTLVAPTGATSDYGISVSVALDGTLVATDYGAHIYIFAP